MGLTAQEQKKRKNEQGRKTWLDCYLSYHTITCTGLLTANIPQPCPVCVCVMKLICNFIIGVRDSSTFLPLTLGCLLRSGGGHFPQWLS